MKLMLYFQGQTRPGAFGAWLLPIFRLALHPLPLFFLPTLAVTFMPRYVTWLLILSLIIFSYFPVFHRNILFYAPTTIHLLLVSLLSGGICGGQHTGDCGEGVRAEAASSQFTRLHSESGRVRRGLQFACAHTYDRGVPWGGSHADFQPGR